MKIHIEIGQYQFIEAEADTVEELEEIYFDVKRTFREGGPGVDPKTWQSALDRYLSTGKMEADTYTEMNDRQKAFIQEIKKAHKRINYEKVSKTIR